MPERLTPEQYRAAEGLDEASPVSEEQALEGMVEKHSQLQDQEIEAGLASPEGKLGPLPEISVAEREIDVQKLADAVQLEFTHCARRLQEVSSDTERQKASAAFDGLRLRFDRERQDYLDGKIKQPDYVRSMQTIFEELLHVEQGLPSA